MDPRPPRLAPYGAPVFLAVVRAHGRGLRHAPTRDRHADSAPAAASPSAVRRADPDAPTRPRSTPRSRRQVQQIRELDAKTPVEPTLLDEATLKKNMTAELRQGQRRPRSSRPRSGCIELLGPDPDGHRRCRDLYVKLLGSQVAGYYDPDDEGALRRVEDRRARTDREVHLRPRVRPRPPGPELRAQEPRPRVDRPGRRDAGPPVGRRGRRDAADDALGAGAPDPGRDARSMATARSNDPEQTKILAEMPPILSETLHVPVPSGPPAGHGRPGRPAAGRPSTRSTRSRRHRPSRSSTPTSTPPARRRSRSPSRRTWPSGSARAGRSTWRTRSASSSSASGSKSAGKVPTATATAAAAGLGRRPGGALVTNGDRAGAVIDTRWDSPADAAEFAAAAQTTLDAIGGHHAMIAIDGTDRVTLFVATDDATISALGERARSGRLAEPGLHLLGGGDPEQAEGVRQGGPASRRRAPGGRPSGPGRPDRRPWRRGRRRGTSRRARSRRP